MTIFSQSHENGLLLSCTRLEIDDVLKDEVKRLLKFDLDWDHIIKTAFQNYVASLLYLNLRRLDENRVPKDVLKRLKEICMSTAGRNMRFQYELLGILAALERKGVKVILLKGAVLIQTVYRNMCLRPMGDIDILVQEKDFHKVRSALCELGYESPKTLPDLAGRQLVEYAHYFDQIRFVHKNRVMIETHFRLPNMGIPSPEENSLWERALPIKVGHANALIPSAEHMLLHLCFHATHHHFSKLYFFYDIAEVFTHYADRLDWDYLLRTVERRNMETSIYYALLYTKRLLHLSISSDILNKFKPSYPRRKLFECIWEKGILRYQGRLSFGRLRGPIHYILEMDRVTDKFIYIFRCLFPPIRWLSHHFGLPESKKLYFKYLASILKNLHVR
jgi:hypothetical protein